MTSFEAFRFPGRREPAPAGRRALERTALHTVDAAERVLLRATPDELEARALVDALVEAGASLRARSNRHLVRSLGRAASRFLDSRDPLRREAEEWLVPEARLSAEMARLVIDRMASDWSADALERLLAAELPDPRVLEEFRPGPAGDRLRAGGERFAFHVGAGNVPGVGATSILRSLLVRTPLLLKPGRGDVILPVLLTRAIAEEDPEIGRCVATLYWPGGTRPPLEEEALARAERVVVYGGPAAVAELRARVPGGTPLVAYGHRVSVGAIARETLGSVSHARRAARDAAEAIAAYDQRGCVSPHLLWIERGGTLDPEAFAELVAEALAEVAEAFPPGPVDQEVAAEVQQLRGTAELKAAAGGGERVFASPGVGWSVIFEPEGGLAPGCGARLVRIRPIEQLEDLPSVLSPWAPLLQSVSVEADPRRREGIGEGLARIGVSRVTTLRRQAWPRPWWMHDGEGPLRVLLRWTTLEGE